jgi:hypothetical protein
MNHFFLKKTIFLNLSILLIALFSYAPIVCAEYEGVQEPPAVTGEEKAIFAYFKLGKKSPDYEKWIKSSPGYKSSPSGKQIQYLIKESLRLDSGFGEYSLDNDPITIFLDIMAKVTSPDEHGKSYFISELSGVDFSNGQIPSFNFHYADDDVVLVVFDITKLGLMPLTPEQYKVITEKNNEIDSFYPAKLTLHIRPSEADHETPVFSDTGKTMWLMSGKIAYMRCSYDDLLHGETDKQIWDYVAPWYKEIYDEKTKVKVVEYPDPFEILKEKK